MLTYNSRLFLFVISLVLLAGIGSAQNTQADEERYLSGFDEKRVLEFAQAEHIPADKLEEFVATFKRNYISRQKFLANAHNDGRTMYVNLTPSGSNAYCPNADFENGNFNNWSGDTWTLPGQPTIWTPPTWASGIVSSGLNASVLDPNARHTLLSTPPLNSNSASGSLIGYDSLTVPVGSTISEVPFLAPGGSGFSVRLGNANTGGETERLVYSVNVSPQNRQFTYQYAVVLNNNTSHATDVQSFFTITIKDANGNQISGSGNCGFYSVTADSAAFDPTFTRSKYDGGNPGSQVPIYYRKWTTISVDLTAYIGQTLTVEFRTADCAGGGHFGYAYIDANCGELKLTVNGLCDSTSTSAYLVAPPGFISYQWQGPNSLNNIPGATNDTLIIPNPIVGDTFTCVMINVSNCQSIATVVIDSSKIGINTLTATPSCNSGHSGSVSVVPNGGVINGYNYIWTTGPNQTGTNVGSTASLNNLAPGTYYVHITSANCPEKDTSITIPELPVPVQNKTVTFCMSTATIPAAAGTSYQWYNNSGAVIPSGQGGTNDTLYLTNALNGQVYTVTYMNTLGCKDSVRNTLQLQNANFTPSSSLSCYGGTSGTINLTNLVPAYAPFNYNWSGTSSGTSSTPSANISITPLAAGTYTINVVSTVNPTCTYTTSVTVSSAPQPPPTVDSLILCPNSSYTIVPPNNLNPNHHWYSQPLNQPTSPVTNLGVVVGSLLVSPLGGGGNGLNTTGVLYIDSVTTTQGCKYVYKTHIRHNYINFAPQSPIIVNNHCYQDSAGTATVIVAGTMAPTGQGLTYTWTGSFPNGAPPPYTTSNPPAYPNSVMIDSLRAGTYTITVSSGGCVKKDTLVITSPPKPNDTLTVQAIFCHGDSAGVLVAPPGLSNYQWYTISTQNGVIIETPVGWATNDSLLIFNPEATYLNFSTTFFINGCRRHHLKIEPVTPPPPFSPEITVNIFSPNSDGKNDRFRPFYHPVMTQKLISYYAEEFNMKIFDRWGRLIYETSNYMNGWDGKRDGKDADDGNYFWIATYKPRCGNSGDVVTKQGFVQLMH